MKTTEDLNALIPIIVAMVRNNSHDIGESYFDHDGDIWGHGYDVADNYICYNKDGWLIEISYECSGEFENDPGDYWDPPCHELIRAWGRVKEISASYYEDGTDDETEFCDEDLKELWNALDEELMEIA